jgi:sugar phosphate isomerase/epimerase
MRILRRKSRCADPSVQRPTLKIQSRIMSSHLKDLDVAPNGHDVPYGTGVSDVKGILDEFAAQGFTGPISIEYEYKQEDNLAEAKQCIEFVRGYTPGK